MHLHRAGTGVGMKKILSFLLLSLIPNTVSSAEAPQNFDEPTEGQRIEEMAQEGRAIIDALFDEARASVIAKEDIMTPEWMSKRRELLQKLQNLHSDATIRFDFDGKSGNPIPRLLSEHVNQKMEQEIPVVFDVEEVSVKRVDDFCEFCHTLCKLNGGDHCGKKIRIIKRDNLHCILKLKAQKTARKELKKEEAEQLRNALLYGSHR